MIFAREKKMIKISNVKNYKNSYFVKKIKENGSLHLI